VTYLLYLSMGVLRRHSPLGFVQSRVHHFKPGPKEVDMIQELTNEACERVCGGEPWASGLNGDPYARQAAAESRGFGGSNLQYTTPVQGNSVISFGCSVAIGGAMAVTGKAIAETKQRNPNAGYTVAGAVAAWGGVIVNCP
jgi:hypothetical protein